MQNNKEWLDKLWIYVNSNKYSQSEKNHINTDNSKFYTEKKKFYTEYVKKQT